MKFIFMTIMLWASFACKERPNHVSSAKESDQQHEGEWVRLISKQEFLESFLNLSRSELVVNYARNFPSLNYSADFTSPVDPTSDLQQQNGSIYLAKGDFYSQRIFGKQYLLWDRTALAVLCLQAFMINDSTWLSEAQKQINLPESIRLDSNTGKELQDDINSRIQELAESTGGQSIEALELIFAYLAMHDSTKTHTRQPQNLFLDAIKQQGISQAIEHDRVLVDILEKAPDSFPELADLNAAQRQALQESVRSLFNLGHFIQGEGTVGSYHASLDALAQSRSSGTWPLYLAHIIPDIAGVAPLPGMNGTIIFTKPKAVRYRYALQALATMHGHGNATKATLEYFDLLLKNEYADLSNLSRDTQILLVQLAEHYEAYTPDKLSDLQTSLSQMNPNLRNILIEEKVIQQGFLDPNNKPSTPEILLQQAPKVLKGKNRTLVQSLELLAEVFEKSRVALTTGEIKPHLKSNTVLLELDNLIDAYHGDSWRLPEVKDGQGKI